MPISTMATSVSSSRRQSVSGSPISLFWLPSATTVRACGAQRAPRMSFVDVLAVEPVTATTRAVERARTAWPERAERAEGVLGDERRRRAGRERVADEVDARRRRRRTGRPAPVRRESMVTPVARSAPGGPLQPARRERCDLVERERDHAAAPSRRRASRATSRSSNGIVRSRSSCPCSWPLPAITTTSPSPAASTARAMAAAPVGLDLLPAVHAREDLLDDRVGLLAARIVGRDDDAVGEAADDLAHQRPLGAVAVAAAAEDADQAAGRQAARLAQGRSRARPACARSRRGRRTAGPRRPARSARARPATCSTPRTIALVLEAEQARRRDGAEDVLDVEASAKPRAHGQPGGPEARRGRRQLELLRTDVGVVGEAEGEERGRRARAARRPAGGRTRRRR